MTISPEQKVETLKSELQQIAKNYQEAKTVMENCERKIHQINGGIEACEDIIKSNKTKKPT